MRQAFKIGITGALLVTACLTTLAQQSGRSGSGFNRGYATDSFEGFDALDQDSRIPQKKKSFWYSVKRDTAALQLEYAMQQEACGRNRPARKGYESLIREWPTTPQAAEAQMALANLLEHQKKFDSAFDEFQYLLTYYAGHCPYDTILDRQFRIANYLLHNNRSMFGWLLNGTDTIRERFEQIVRNAPRSSIAPEVMLIIGSIRVSEDERQEAIAVYDGILNRFPSSKQAVSAAYLSSKCRYELAVKHQYNESRCREAISFQKHFCHGFPTTPKNSS